MLMISGKGMQQNVEGGRRFIQAAIDRGWKQAHRYLGKSAEEGIGEPVNMTVAFRNYRLAGEAGDTPSALRAAKMLARGQGCERAPKAAAVILDKLIRERKCVEARVEYGLLLLKGEGVAQNFEAAKEMFRIAAQAGNQQAVEYLRQMRRNQQQKEQARAFGQHYPGVFFFP
jgi:TPR repeat protein